MMKRLVSILFAVLMATGMPMSVSAQGHFEDSKGGLYVAPDVGARFIHSDVDFDIGYLFGVGVGYDTDRGLRGEFEISYANNGVSNLDGVDVSFLGFLGKGYYDFHLETSSFTPFIGIALGLTRLKASISGFGFTVSDTDTQVTYGGIAGFRVSVNANVSVGMEYNFLGYDTDDPDFSSSVMAGLQYKF